MKRQTKIRSKCHPTRTFSF